MEGSIGTGTSKMGRIGKTRYDTTRYEKEKLN